MYDPLTRAAREYDLLSLADGVIDMITICALLYKAIAPFSRLGRTG